MKQTLCGLVLLVLACSSANAALVQVTMTAVADNTFVGSGDPCGSGLSGGNACNGKTLVISIVIDTDAAPADQDSATNHSFHRVTASPGFVAASLTLNGFLFSLPANASSNFDQSVEMDDNLDGGGFGILDRVKFGVSGNSATDSFSMAPTVQMTSGAFTGDALAALGTIVGSPLAVSGVLSLSNGTFSVSNATGQVSGQYRPSAVSFSTSAPTDTDADGVADSLDNCTLVTNPTQLDADNDGYGNACDGDLNGSGLTTATDYTLLRNVLNQPASASPTAAAADLNGSGLVTATDATLLRNRLNTAPGPSGYGCGQPAGSIACP